MVPEAAVQVVPLNETCPRLERSHSSSEIIAGTVAHFGAILFHTLIVRDGILERMVPWNIRPRGAASTDSRPSTKASSASNEM